MSGEDRLVVLPCAQCGGPGVFGYELPGGHQLNLCLTHADQFEQMNQRRIEMMQEHMDRLDDEMNDIVGLPRNPRPARIPAPRINLNQVHIHGPNLGVVNTGTVGKIENSLSIINASDQGLALRLKQFTEAVLQSGDLDDAQKREAVDLVSEIAEDVSKPAPNRRSKAVMRAVVDGLERVLAGAANLASLWSAIGSGLP